MRIVKVIGIATIAAAIFAGPAAADGFGWDTPPGPTHTVTAIAEHSSTTLDTPDGFGWDGGGSGH